MKMKKLLFFICSLTILTTACSTQSSDSPEVNPDVPGNSGSISPDSVYVSLDPTSLEWSVSPMTRASKDDLYALIVYQSKNEYDDYVNNVLYSLSLFDDPALITLKLAKNRYYHFKMAYVPNGKNVIAYYDNHYGSPFYVAYAKTPELNSTIYNPESVTIGFVEHSSQEKGVKEWLMQYTLINEVLRYMGTVRNFFPIENNQKVNIPLYRWQYGIRITVRDFTEGTVCFKGVFPEGKVLSLTSNSSGTSSMEHFLEFPISLERAFSYENAADFADSEDMLGDTSRSITYINPRGEEIILWNSGNKYPFKRMMMHTLEFSLSDAIINGGIDNEIMEDADAPLPETNWEF